MAVIAFGLIIVKTKSNYSTNKSELGIILSIFLGILSLYNLLYNLNVPLFLAITAVFILSAFLCHIFITWEIDEKNELKDTFLFFAVLNALIILEIFLSLYFWPVSPEIKSLIIAVIFYLASNLIYLYIHNVLHLKRTVGFISVSFILVGIILLTVWYKLSH